MVFPFNPASPDKDLIVMGSPEGLEREEETKKIQFSKKDKFWMYLVIALFLALFVVVLVFGDGVLGSLF